MGKKRMLFLSAVIVLVLAVGVQAFDLTEFGFKPAGSYDFGGETVTIISWTSERMETLYFKAICRFWIR